MKGDGGKRRCGVQQIAGRLGVNGVAERLARVSPECRVALDGGRRSIRRKSSASARPAMITIR
jgi:hypothetical protein